MTKENLDKQSIKKYAENAYLNYSMSFWIELYPILEMG